MELASQKLQETKEEMEQVSKQFHEFLDKTVQLAKYEFEYSNTSKNERENLKKHESALDRCEKKQQELMAAKQKFNEFESSNHKYIKVLKEKYKIKWQEFEKTWYKWKIPEISMYLKYGLVSSGKIATINISCDSNSVSEEKISEQNSDINWDQFEKNLKEEKFKSKYLDRIDKSDLKSFGIENYELRMDIYKIIQNLCKNNPIPIENDNECEGQVRTGSRSMLSNDKIDSKYLCPLTKEVMINPVIAFDEQCYEKEAIVAYFRKHKKSPTTQEQIDDVEWVIELLVENKSLKDEIKQKELL